MPKLRLEGIINSGDHSILCINLSEDNGRLVGSATSGLVMVSERGGRGGESSLLFVRLHLTLLCILRTFQKFLLYYTCQRLWLWFWQSFPGFRLYCNIWHVRAIPTYRVYTYIQSLYRLCDENACTSTHFGSHGFVQSR